MSAELNVLFAGLPKTGKTSFLALLYIAIMRGKAPGLILGSFQDDREYAQSIANRLNRCEEATHTEVNEVRRLQLSLALGEARRQALLRIPDLSGETWEEVAVQREWSTALDASVRSSESALIFVHANRVDSHPSVATVRRGASALGADLAGTSKPVDGKPRAGATVSPTQVHVVDMLQLLAEERQVRPARAGLVVSAWDIVDQSIAPRAWLDREMPLVSQYVGANSDWLEFDVYGVSAQGGSFNDAASKEALCKEDALERAIIKDGRGQSTSIGTPIRWALRDDGAS